MNELYKSIFTNSHFGDLEEWMIHVQCFNKDRGRCVCVCVCVFGGKVRSSHLAPLFRSPLLLGIDHHCFQGDHNLQPVTQLNLKTFKCLKRVSAQFTYIPYGLLHFAVRGNELEGKYWGLAKLYANETATFILYAPTEYPTTFCIQEILYHTFITATRQVFNSKVLVFVTYASDSIISLNTFTPHQLVYVCVNYGVCNPIINS